MNARISDTDDADFVGSELLHGYFGGDMVNLIERQPLDLVALDSWRFVFSFLMSRYCRLTICKELTVVITKLKHSLIDNEIGK